MILIAGCLKDLKRFWKLDDNDDDRTVARIFYQIGLLKNDLIPIVLSTIGTGAKGDRIALACGPYSFLSRFCSTLTRQCSRIDCSNDLAHRCRFRIERIPNE